MKDCPVCKSKIDKDHYNFVMYTANDPKKLKEWMKGTWTFEKYMELK